MTSIKNHIKCYHCPRLRFNIINNAAIAQKAVLYDLFVCTVLTQSSCLVEWHATPSWVNTLWTKHMPLLTCVVVQQICRFLQPQSAAESNWNPFKYFVQGLSHILDNWLKFWSLIVHKVIRSIPRGHNLTTGWPTLASINSKGILLAWALATLWFQLQSRNFRKAVR